MTFPDSFVANSCREIAKISVPFWLAKSIFSTPKRQSYFTTWSQPLFKLNLVLLIALIHFHRPNFLNTHGFSLCGEIQGFFFFLKLSYFIVNILGTAAILAFVTLVPMGKQTRMA
jgi:hypothetical protein